MILAALAVACGGGGESPAAPAPAPAPAPSPAPSPSPSPTPTPGASAGLSISSISANTEAVSGGGYRYVVSFRVTETSGRSGLSIASVKLSFSNSTRNGSCVYDTPFTPAQVAAGGAATSSPLTCTDDIATASTLMTALTITVNFTDSNGVAGNAVSNSTAINPPPIANPAPAAGTKYDGLYDFRIEEPQPGGTKTTINAAQYFRVRNGQISSTDGLLAGSVDTFGKATFQSACPFGAKDPATYTGSLNVGAGPTGNFGQGTYSCIDTPTYNWFVNNGK